jgi:HEAT repeat protein
MADLPDFLKDLPDAPPPPVLRRNRLGLTLQFFVVPAAIVGICVGVFLLFRFMTEETQALPDLFHRMVNGTGHQKAVYADGFVRRIMSDRGDYARPAPEPLLQLVPKIVDVVDKLTGRPLSLEEGYTKRMCIKALGIIGDRESAHSVVRFLQADADEVVQAECLQTLGALKNPDVAPAVRRCLESDSAVVRKYAAFNAGALGTAELIPDLEKRLADDSIPVRWNAAFALAYFLKSPGGVGVLLKMLDRAEVARATDPKDSMQAFFIDNAMVMAAQALAVVKPPEARAALQQVASADPSPQVRNACLEALKAYSR